MKRKLFILFFLATCTVINAQNSFKGKVLDAKTNEILTGATFILAGTNNGVSTNISGIATLNNIANGTQTIEISFIGYEKQNLKLIFPLKNNKLYTIMLQESDEELGEVVIEATRGNRTIANLPTRTEALTDEIDEAASMEPSKISHLITHSTGIQVQTTAAGSNGKVVRIQGLNGRYTQMLKDGFPLYGGFSGSLDVLQIPPLDLRQVEYIKGSASTLYGGGAIAGLINLLTKKAEKKETLLHMNISHIGARDLNFFIARKFGKWGLTNLASMHIHNPYDADEDGFSDIAKVEKFNLNPKIFYTPNNKTSLYLGITMSQEDRKGGSMTIINDEVTTNKFYLDAQESSRLTSQFSAKHKITSTNTISLRNSISLFERKINIDENILHSSYTFGGKQMNTFTELNLNISKENQTINVGLNFLTDKFTEDENLIEITTVELPEGGGNIVRNQEYQTVGAYINHLWDVTDKLALESGLRVDKVDAATLNTENGGESFVLPKASALYKINPEFSVRLGGGMGYRMPTIFNEESEPFAYKGIQAINFEQLVAERSYGTNIDFKYQSTFATDNILLTLNQMFFYNIIDNPITFNKRDLPPGYDPAFSIGNFEDAYFDQREDSLLSKGFESQIKLTVGKFTWFFGYTYTDAYLQNGNNKNTLTLTPKHSVKGDLLFVEEGKWRIGWDYDYKSEQLLSNNSRSPRLFSTGIVVERTIGKFVIFLNAENFTDIRQSKYERVQKNGSPQFAEVWAPLDGYFFNAGLKIKI